MSTRYTVKARGAMTTVAITAGLFLMVAGCGGGDEDAQKNSSGESSASSSKGEESGGKKNPTLDEDQVLAEVKGGDSITLTISSAVRDSGGFVTVSGKVTNGSGKRWVAPYWQGEETELRQNTSSVAGATLVDKDGKKRYYILRDTDGKCLCTRFTGGISANETETWFAQFPAPPESTTEVDFQIADMPPATIEISEGE